MHKLLSIDIMDISPTEFWAFLSLMYKYKNACKNKIMQHDNIIKYIVRLFGTCKIEKIQCILQNAKEA